MTIRRTETPDNGTGAVQISARPPALVGIRIPSRNENARQLVVRVYEENAHLQRADLWAVTRYAELSWKFRRLSELMERLPDDGLMRKDLEPRKLLSELRALSDTLLRHERDLGITAVARAGLGVDVGRIRKLAEDGASPADEAAVIAAERRILLLLGSSSEEDVSVGARESRERDDD